MRYDEAKQTIGDTVSVAMKCTLSLFRTCFPFITISLVLIPIIIPNIYYVNPSLSFLTISFVGNTMID
jgi:hypothetical protein